MKNNNKEFNFISSIVIDEKKTTLQPTLQENTFEQMPIAEDIKTILNHIILLALPTPSLRIH